MSTKVQSNNNHKYNEILKHLQKLHGDTAKKHVVVEKLMNMPDKQFDLYQITGSKGKSSVGYFLAQLLNKSLLFSSPHVYTVRERIMHNARPITVDSFNKSISPYIFQDMDENHNIGPFSTLFLASIEYFKTNVAQIDNLIYEVGIGGNRDVTKLLNNYNKQINKKVMLLTQVELEHTNILGKTLYEIALDKTKLTDKKCDKFIIHHQNYHNKEVYSGICDAMNDIGIGHDKIVISENTKDVFKDCLSMALEAVGAQKSMNGLNISGYQGKNFYDYRKRSSRIQLLPARKTFFKDFSQNFFYIDGSHTENSVRDLIQRNGFQSRRHNIIFSQSKDHRNYKKFIDIILQELNINNNINFLVVTPPSSFDLFVDPHATTTQTTSLNDGVHEYLLSIGQKSRRLKTYSELAAFLANMKEENCFVAGSLLSAALVLRAMDGS